jgi:hypothetical protein
MLNETKVYFHMLGPRVEIHFLKSLLKSFVTLNVKILIFLRLKEVFETDVLNFFVLTTVKIINYSIKAPQSHENFTNST